MISLLLWATLFLSMTYNKYTKYNFTIHQIDTHGTVLKGLMSFLISNFVWLVMNSSVSSGLFPSIYFSSVIEVFFRCYFRIIRHSMLRSQDELNILLRSVWLKTLVSFHKGLIHKVNEEDKEFERSSLIIPWFG